MTAAEVIEHLKSFGLATKPPEMMEVGDGSVRTQVEER